MRQTRPLSRVPTWIPPTYMKPNLCVEETMEKYIKNENDNV